VAEQSAAHDAQTEAMMRKLTDAGTQCLLNLLVALPNSRRAEREADLVRLGREASTLATTYTSTVPMCCTPYSGTTCI
jgi:hypothetical protein